MICNFALIFITSHKCYTHMAIHRIPLGGIPDAVGAPTVLGFLGRNKLSMNKWPWLPPAADIVPLGIMSWCLFSNQRNNSNSLPPQKAPVPSSEVSPGTDFSLNVHNDGGGFHQCQITTHYRRLHFSLMPLSAGLTSLNRAQCRLSSLYSSFRGFPRLQIPGSLFHCLIQPRMVGSPSLHEPPSQGACLNNDYVLLWGTLAVSSQNNKTFPCMLESLKDPGTHFSHVNERGWGLSWNHGDGRPRNHNSSSGKLTTRSVLMSSQFFLSDHSHDCFLGGWSLCLLVLYMYVTQTPHNCHPINTTRTKTTTTTNKTISRLKRVLGLPVGGYIPQEGWVLRGLPLSCPFPVRKASMCAHPSLTLVFHCK